jgi:transcriptional regulator with XRE-family HTH domain
MNEKSILELFGNQLRDIRTKKGFSQEGLALECGLDRSYVGGVERGERNISLINIIRLAEALNVKPTELLKNQ